MKLRTVEWDSAQATVCWPERLDECHTIPNLLSCVERPVITLVGNLTIEPAAYRHACRTLLEQCVFPLAARNGAILISRGFSLGNQPENDLPWLIDQVAAQNSQRVTLIGVGLDVCVALPGKESVEPWRNSTLNEHHTAYLLAPGLNERDACVWRSELVSVITAPHLLGGNVQRSVTLVFGGSAMTWFDVLESASHKRLTIALTHKGVIGVSASIQQLLAGAPVPRTLMADLNQRLEREIPGMLRDGWLSAVSSKHPLLLHSLLADLLCENSPPLLQQMTVTDDELSLLPAHIPHEGERITNVYAGYAVPGDGPAQSKRNAIYDWECLLLLYDPKETYLYGIFPTMLEFQGKCCAYCGKALSFSAAETY